MKKSYIALMTIAGLSSLQASSEKISNLTRALRNAANPVVMVDSADVESNVSESPQNRTQSTFQAIATGNATDAGELAADLVADKKMTPDQVVRSVMQSPIQDQIAFAQSYNLRNRMNSPFYKKCENALNNDAYSNEDKAEIQKALNAYLNGEKMDALRIPSPAK